MSFRVDLNVIAQQEQLSRFALTLHNLSDDAITIQSFNFIFDRYVTPNSVQHGTFTQVGSHCRFTPSSARLDANDSMYLEFEVNTFPLRYLSDGIKDACIETIEFKKPISVTRTPIVLVKPTATEETVPAVEPSKLALIPQPTHLTRADGNLILGREFNLVSCHPDAQAAIQWLQDESLSLHGLSLRITPTDSHPSIDYIHNPIFDQDAYRITVTALGCLVEAGEPAGFHNASATLLQLMQTNSIGHCSLPVVTIKDSPRFSYRGFMLDCARHFHPISSIKRLINQLAHYKINTFHWHLTDDEAWRIEIKALPELTDIGAWRGPGLPIEPQFSHASQKYGGVYTQQQIKGLIEYAQRRGITIIPEIDIPGHCRAAIRSLPDMLVDTDDPSRYRSVQNYSDNVLSPALKGTYQFLDIVLEEIAQLFPSQWVHIGADEVPKGVWVDSAACQAMMLEHGYQSPVELQGHLLRYAEQKLKSFGKRMVGWEEAQHGNKVSKETVIYSWLSEDAAINCAKQGFDVILQPAQYTYLDMAQSDMASEPGVDWANSISLKHAYHYRPLSAVDEQDPIHKRVLGIQAAIWSEIITDQERLDYMLFPRITALAEVMWSREQQRHWPDYLARLKGHLTQLKRQGVTYRAPWN
ncbi:beta-N-acetylhexosaminidase [Vibrio agarivorans]|uniref:beta-N-acetylhexosaminidase n=1 Tax=Vibrio agarivorans TaxID=153622 RepID=A0ABT7XWZ0_9VIBR|nr:beta-N-acetylhexosaminidase [Vibrio agarivorans]MDN2480292.1 beta-N-acetylhexosaminidase [Vibrio agarivorans]